MRRSIVFVPFALIALVPLLPAAAPGAARLHAGDVVSASAAYGWGGPLCLWRLSAATLDTTRLSTGGLLLDPRSLAVAPDGGVLVADEISGLLRIDPADGAQQLLASPASLGGNPAGVLVSPLGQVFVSIGSGGAPKVIEITSGGTPLREVTSGVHLASPSGMVMGPSGELYVAERLIPGVRGNPYGSIVRVDPVSGEQSVLISGGFMFGPQSLAITPSGLIYAAHIGTLNGRQALFTRTSIADGSTERDPDLLSWESCFVASSGGDDPYVNVCNLISYSCYTPIVSRRSATWTGPAAACWLMGPMVVVPDGPTPERRGTWGALKVRYR